MDGIETTDLFATHEPHRRRVWGGRFRHWANVAIPPVVVFVVFVAVWQLGVFHRLFDLKHYQLTYPEQIWEALQEEAALLLDYAAVTVLEAVVGYVLGSSLGLLAGILFVHSEFWRKGLAPLVSTFNAMPIVAFAPLMLLYFGYGPESKIAVVTFMTFAPMAVQSFKGLYSLDELSHDLMKSYNASPWDIFVHFRWHSALPHIFVALRLNATLSMIGAVIGEFFGAHGGLGFMISTSIHIFQMPVAWATIVVAAAIGIALYSAVGFVERLVIPWHASFRSE